MAATISSALKWWSLETPQQLALRVGDQDIGYAELDAWVDRIADQLQKAGLKHGDRVGTVGATSIPHCALLLGVIRAGGIASPVSSRLTEREAQEFFEKTRPSCVFLDADQLSRHPRLGDIAGPQRPMAEVEGMRAASFEPRHWDNDPEDSVGIIATSGSTARPKGVVYTHRSMLSYAAEFSMGEAFCGPGSRGIALSPLSTSGGFVQMIEYIVLGATLRFEAAFDPERALQLLAGERINMFQGVPLFFERIAACPGFAEADLSQLRFTGIGGARVPRSLLDTWMRKGCLLRQIYGQTEAGGAITFMSRRDGEKYPEKAGRGGMFTEIRVIDENGQFLGPDQTGQIVIRGPSVMKGYWEDPEATAKTLVDGWLRTGDLGSVDEQGYLSFFDRMKDIIISGGLNISAAEVERVVAEFPGVLEVAVIGAADDKFGETPLAVVHARGSLDIAGLVAYCNQNLSNYKVPRYVEVEAEPLPRLATGKLAKPAIRSKYAPLVPTLVRVR